MKLFILSRGTPAATGEMDWIVVRAPDYKDAREIASQAAQKEGPSPWLNDTQSTCCELTPSETVGPVFIHMHR